MLREAFRAAVSLGAADVVSVGDYGFWPGSSGKQFLDVCDQMAARRGLRLVVAPGNHEDASMLAAAPIGDDGLIVVRPQVLAAPRGHTLRLGRFAWRFLGGAASIDGPGGLPPQTRGPLDREQLVRDPIGGDVVRPAGFDLGGWWPGERITQDDVDATVAAGPADVLVTHDAPTELDVRSAHKTTDRFDWPLGWRQREMVSEARVAVGPAVSLCGHWHQHAVSHDPMGLMVALSADVNPQEPQWVVVEDDGRSERPRLLVAARWGTQAALTGTDEHGRPRAAHRCDPAALELDELEWDDPSAYVWPDA